MITKKFHIVRSGSKSRLDSFTVVCDDEATVLAALISVRDSQDRSISMRYSCRQAICGSCSMRINGKPRLACNTLVKDLSDDITVAPLSNHRVLKDLVVDLTKFFSDFRAVKPFLQPATPPPDGKEYRQSPRERERISELSDCIMCGCCQGGCPVVGKTPAQFTGPAIMVQSLRFIDDSRDGATAERLASVSQEDGAPACDQFGNCSDVCPKGISPSMAVRRLRQLSFRSRVTSLFTKKKSHVS